MATIYGFDVEAKTIGGADLVKVTTPEKAIVLTLAEYDEVVRVATDARSFLVGLAEFEKESEARWEREEGPGSDLGTHVEEGTPTTDHSSDPSA